MEFFSKHALKRKIWRGISGAKDNKRGDTGGGNGGDDNGGGASEWIVLIVLLLFFACASVFVCLALYF